MSDEDDVEKERTDYEVSRLARDTIMVPTVGVIAAVLTGPIGGAIAGIGYGVKAIIDKGRRDSEWDDK